MVIKNKTKQVLPFMIFDVAGKREQKILRPGNTFELSPDQVTPDIEGKIKKKMLVVVEE